LDIFKWSNGVKFEFPQAFQRADFEREASLALAGWRSPDTGGAPVPLGLLNQSFFASRALSNATSRKNNHRAMYQCPLPAIDW
jgi:hypothetical protein